MISEKNPYWCGFDVVDVVDVVFDVVFDVDSSGVPQKS